MEIISSSTAKDRQEMDNQQSLKRANLLLEGAMPLLALIMAIRQADPPSKLEKFRIKILEEIKAFELYLKENGYLEQIVLAARYCICTAIDEKVFKTCWGAKSLWLQQSLLTTLYQEVNGGEKFYLIAEVLLEKPLENLDLLELIYFILSLDFKGKFYQNEKKLEAFRDHLFRTLIGFKAEETELSQGKARNVKYKGLYSLPFLAIIALVGSVLLITSLHLKNYSKSYAEGIYALLEPLPSTNPEERGSN